jgi:TRAP-type uncharacterized transport system fused permease subunit
VVQPNFWKCKTWDECISITHKNIVVGVINSVNRLNIKDLWYALSTGAKNTLTVGAAAATVSIVAGVGTLTSVGFKPGYVVVQTSTEFADVIFVI